MIYRLICTCILLSYLSACDDPNSRSPNEMVNELMTIWESGEAGRLPELMSSDIVYHDIPNGASLQGINASVDYVTHVHKWATNVEMTVHRSFGNEVDAVAEWTMPLQDWPVGRCLCDTLLAKITTKRVGGIGSVLL